MSVAQRFVSRKYHAKRSAALAPVAWWSSSWSLAPMRTASLSIHEASFVVRLRSVMRISDSTVSLDINLSCSIFLTISPRRAGTSGP